jgi:hypothetical protein
VTRACLGTKACQRPGVRQCPGASRAFARAGVRARVTARACEYFTGPVGGDVGRISIVRSVEHARARARLGRICPGAEIRAGLAPRLPLRPGSMPPSTARRNLVSIFRALYKVTFSCRPIVGIRSNALPASFLIVRLCLSVSVTSAHHPWTIREGVGVTPCSWHGFESQGIGGDIHLFLMV